MFWKYNAMMSYLEFREKLLPDGCFSVHQARACFPNFDRNNLTRWSHDELLIKLRRGWYAFPEMLRRPDFSRYVACRIYRPSYISLHMALSIYGMIPEAVTDITAVTTLKTAHFENSFGQYFYQNLKPSMYFGYKPVTLSSATSAVGSPVQIWLLAHPEKALLDLLYLYPFYDSEAELEQLRLDEYFMTEELDTCRLTEYLSKIGCRALDSRVKKLLKIYGI